MCINPPTSIYTTYHIPYPISHIPPTPGVSAGVRAGDGGHNFLRVDILLHQQPALLPAGVHITPYMYTDMH
jgi:hypothetical protein